LLGQLIRIFAGKKLPQNQIMDRLRNFIHASLPRTNLSPPDPIAS
jgi:hypothetical protein